MLLNLKPLILDEYSQTFVPRYLLLVRNHCMILRTKAIWLALHIPIANSEHVLG